MVSFFAPAVLLALSRVYLILNIIHTALPKPSQSFGTQKRFRFITYKGHHRLVKDLTEKTGKPSEELVSILTLIKRFFATKTVFGWLFYVFRIAE